MSPSLQMGNTAHRGNRGRLLVWSDGASGGRFQKCPFDFLAALLPCAASQRGAGPGYPPQVGFQVREISDRCGG